MSIEIRASHLRVISSTLSNIASALFLAPFTVQNISVLLVSLIFAIILFGSAVKIEDILEEI